MRQGWRLYLAARGGFSYCLLWAVALLLVLSDVSGGITIYPIQFVAALLPRYTPISELLPVVAGMLGVALLVPRLWSWERLGRRGRVRWRAAVCAIAALALPASIPWLVHYRLPPEARWWDIVWNIVLLTAIAMLATVALGRVLGPLLGVAVYAAAIAVQQVTPDIARWLPISGASTNLRPHIATAAGLAVLAVAVWTITLGRSRFADNLTRNEDG